MYCIIKFVLLHYACISRVESIFKYLLTVNLINLNFYYNSINVL